MNNTVTMNNTKTGLVLEGGAMRGMFTAGVLDVFMENGISFPDCIGVSAGAAFGCNLKSNQPGRVLRYNLKFCREPKFCSFRSLITTGDLYGAKFCYHEGRVISGSTLLTTIATSGYAPRLQCRLCRA